MPRATPPTNRSSAPRPTISKETRHAPSPTSMLILLRFLGGMFLEPFSQGEYNPRHSCQDAASARLVGLPDIMWFCRFHTL
jgi:hypothetical protein